MFGLEDETVRITVEQRNQYGATVFYPVSEAAKILAAITRTTTLTERTLKLASEMGCLVHVVQPDPVRF